VMGSSEISNFSSRGVPITRAQSFRVPYAADLKTTREILTRAVSMAEGVRTTPPPLVFIRDTTESWVVFRCVYAIDDYARQFTIGSNVISAVVDSLKEAGFPGAANRVQLVSENGNATQA
jgi:small-conductance mechanosensitive channel